MCCFNCGGKNFIVISKKVRDSNRHEIVKCKSCGLLQIKPMPTILEDRYFYDENFQSKNIGEPDDLKSMRSNSIYDTDRRANFISTHITKKQKILDIGSGYGFFLHEMNDRGYDITGIEISKKKREISSRVSTAKVLNINLIKEDLSLCNFDFITLFHVLEHIVNPIEFLKIIKKHLNDKGQLIIEVPNSEDMLLDACEKYRDFYWQRAHLYYFNYNTLKEIVEKSGFSIVDFFFVQRYSLDNFMNWFISGEPMIEKPVFETEGTYKWLEDYYKKHLCQTGRSDTLILIAK